MSSDATSVAATPALAEPEADANRHHKYLFAGLAVLLLIAPAALYPFFVMKVLCFALFAAAFNLLLGYGGLLKAATSGYVDRLYVDCPSLPHLFD